QRHPQQRAPLVASGGRAGVRHRLPRPAPRRCAQTPPQSRRAKALTDNGRMNIQLLSDLHLEANPDFQPVPVPGADLLVLAGDVGSYQQQRGGRVMDEPDWGLARFADWPVPVLFVPGNHEYDALDVDVAHADLREA